ncbi:LysR family transcriptional regulator [Thalassotalea atypica]|uniref:LysR family transcriptional regulator n=1 Tax=Thalassotalea atypica TaxID=2054316 RepID=UPI0025730334|nr:LysR family transcriptional regulator [Thalassotalea atypica]
MHNLEQKLARIDLNLLVALSVILKEGSITKAAQTLFVTQPAMSKTLQRLRDLFDDPLFYRTPNGMAPTAKAKEVEKRLPKILAEIEHLFSTQEFNPAMCEQTFSVSVPSVLCHAIWLPLLARLECVAPHVCLIDLPSDADPISALEKGRYDFAVHIVKPQSGQCHYTSLGTIRPHVYARKSHPLAQSISKNKLEDLERFKFVDYQVGPTESKSFENPIEKFNRVLNFKPTVVYKSSQLSLLTELLANNDYLFISPSLMMNSPDFSDKFVSVLEIDIAEHYLYELVLLEGPHIAHGQAEQWMKNELINSISIK